MNIVPYRAKLPDLPLPEKRHGGAFRLGNEMPSSV